MTDTHWWAACPSVRPSVCSHADQN